MGQVPDEDVAGAFSDGHPDALALVYQRFGALVYSIALRSLDARSDAEDVTQQVFVSAWRSRGSFDRGRGTLGGWLVTITRNKVADVLRARQRDSRVLLQAAGGAVAPARRGTDRRRGARTIWPRRRLATALAGLAAGLIIGVGGTVGVVQLTRAPATHVVAQIELRPLPGFPRFQDTTGTAVMRATASQQLMDVTLHAPRQPGFCEVWLLARDGVSMISLGDLNAGQTGTFIIPPRTDLRNYSRIDVSLQPFNGSTQHSKISVVRGSLPTAALPA